MLSITVENLWGIFHLRKYIYQQYTSKNKGHICIR